MERAKLLDILHKITLFKDLSDKELNYVLDMPKVYKTFYPGDAIVKEGEKDACFFILLSGSASVFLKDQELAQIVPPQFVGEVGFIFNEARIATVVANKTVLAMQLDAERFAELPGSIRETVKDKIIAGLVLRLARLNESVATMKVKTAMPGLI